MPGIASITAQNPRWNATLIRAREIQADLQAQRLSGNPRIYADQFIFGGCMMPETSKQDNSDLAGWATQNWDGSTTLENIEGTGLPADRPAYLTIFVVEGGSD